MKLVSTLKGKSLMALLTLVIYPIAGNTAVTSGASTPAYSGNTSPTVVPAFHAWEYISKAPFLNN